MTTARAKTAGVALVVLLALVPVLWGRFGAWVVANILVLCVFAVGFNLLFGYAGLLSFGHAGIFAVGAYVAAGVLLVYPSLPVVLVAGTVAAGVASLVIGYLSIRHTRIYFAMITLAFGMMIHSVIIKWRDVTHGDDGIVGLPRGVLGLPGWGVDLSRLELFYFLVLAVSVAAVVVLHRITKSSFGLALQAVRDSEVRTRFAGLSSRSLLLRAFVVSGIYAGLAGSLAAPLARAATPSLAHWTTGAEPVLAALLGGIHSFAGPLVGAAVLRLSKEYIVQTTEYWLLVQGIVVVALVLAFRGGIAGTMERLIASRRETRD